MSITLRPYQEEIIIKTRNLMQQGNRTVLIQAPTGSGKTALTAQMLKTASLRGMPSLFLCHRRELIIQSSNAFKEFNISHGVIANGFHFSDRHFVQIGSIQTVKNRINRIRKPKLVVFDECQHQAAGTWDKVHQAFPEAFIIGLSASPSRLDGTGLGKWYSCIINGPTVQWLIDNNFLSPYKLYAPSNIDISKVHTKMGDFVISELSEAMDKPTITGDAIKEYKRLAMGKRAIVRGVSIKHSQHIAEQFNKAGIKAVHVDGKTPIAERDESIESFRRGDTLILTNVDIFSEGLDIPSVECVIDLRPTKSLVLYLQFIGRALRPSDGKSHAIIIDHAGNVHRFGLPCDLREWSLEGRKKEKKVDDSPKVKLCPECYFCTQSWRKECPGCGWAFVAESREVAHVKGDLTEVDIEALKKARRMEQGRSSTYEDLVALGKSRNMKNPHAWARIVIKAREAKRKKAGEW